MRRVSESVHCVPRLVRGDPRTRGAALGTHDARKNGRVRAVSGAARGAAAATQWQGGASPCMQGWGMVHERAACAHRAARLGIVCAQTRKMMHRSVHLAPALAREVRHNQPSNALDITTPSTIDLARASATTLYCTSFYAILVAFILIVLAAYINIYIY